MEVATFGYGEPNETTLVSGGHWDIFVARYDSSGKLRWAKRAGGAGSDQGIGIAVDGEGGCFVTGVIAEAAVFAPGEANQTILMAEGSWDTFVARYDSNGVLHWVKQITGPAAIGGVGIATDWAGNSAVSGYFLGTATFAPGEGNQTTLTSFGNLDVFVAKYETGGGLAWVKRIGGPGPDQGAGVVFDSVGKIRVTGSFSETITFGAGETNETELTSTGGQDIFLAMYGASAGPSIEGLIDEITGLQDQGILAPGLESALIEKLEAAAASLGRGNVNAAAGQLRAFTNQVSALLRSGQLPAGAGQSLIDAANQILSACCS